MMLFLPYEQVADAVQEQLQCDRMNLELDYLEQRRNLEAQYQQDIATTERWYQDKIIAQFEHAAVTLQPLEDNDPFWPALLTGDKLYSWLRWREVVYAPLHG